MSNCSMRSLFHWNSVNFTRNTVIHNILWIWELYFWSKFVWNSNARRPTHFDVYGFCCMNHGASSVVAIFQSQNMRAISTKPLISRMTKTISQHYGNIDSWLQFSELNCIHLIRRIVTVWIENSFGGRRGETQLDKKLGICVFNLILFTNIFPVWFVCNLLYASQWFETVFFGEKKAKNDSRKFWMKELECVCVRERKTEI